eukprot:scaffold1971_cov356-Pinguiococcus_pyrenoidosus.AAC.2
MERCRRKAKPTKAGVPMTCWSPACFHMPHREQHPSVHVPLLRHHGSAVFLRHHGSAIFLRHHDSAIFLTQDCPLYIAALDVLLLLSHEVEKLVGVQAPIPVGVEALHQRAQVSLAQVVHAYHLQRLAELADGQAGIAADVAFVENRHQPVVRHHTSRRLRDLPSSEEALPAEECPQELPVVHLARVAGIKVAKESEHLCDVQVRHEDLQSFPEVPNVQDAVTILIEGFKDAANV